MMTERRRITMGHIIQEHLKQSRVAIPPLDLIKNLDKKLKPNRGLVNVIANILLLAPP